MQSKCKVIAVANQKGGVGKTTTTEHLGIGLVRQGKNVLLIDMDPQANLTASLGWKNVDTLKKTVFDVLEAIMLEKDVSFEDMILHHDEGVDLIPSNIRLADIDQRLTGAFVKEKTLTMDMYTPYRELVRKMFPNVKIIIDRFHIIQLISRSLNQTRTAVMKQDSRHYRKLKRYWKLILKNEEDLDNSTFKKYICFKHMMRETDVVHYLVSRDPQLQATYELYQDLLNAIKHRNADRFFNTCHNAGELISGFMKKTVRSLLDHEDGIRNALSHTFSNGVIEGTNNLIKVIKRIAFGYRSFVSFKIRILLITNTLVRFHNKRRGTFLVTSS